MSLRNFPAPKGLSVTALVLGGAYLVASYGLLHFDATLSLKRFHSLVESGQAYTAGWRGARAYALLKADGAPSEDLGYLARDVADAYSAGQKHGKAAKFYGEAYDLLAGTPDADLATLTALRNTSARAALLSGDAVTATDTYAAFLDEAGDYAATTVQNLMTEDSERQRWMSRRVWASAPLFADAFGDVGEKADIGALSANDAALERADSLAALGGFFSQEKKGLTAAAATLGAAYKLRLNSLGPEDQATLDVMLSLGQVLADLDRPKEAEKLFLTVFHVQERLQGANSPDLSLYLKLLAEVYQAQGRATEAEAFYEHIRRLFIDAFGAQRYEPNQQRDRRTDINRPVSSSFPLPEDYVPDDLVAAADYGIPVAKDPNLDEMRIRLAKGENEDDNMAVHLAALVQTCTAESNEAIALRSGFRSFLAQSGLYERDGYRGMTALPGESEHQTGLAVDMNVNDRFMRISDKSYQCFQRIAFQHGFILTYPPGNTYLPNAPSHEPWHWRYVGVPTARLYREIGPRNKPLEFLAALPCYERFAASEIKAPLAARQDICLAGEAKYAAAFSGGGAAGGAVGAP